MLRSRKTHYDVLIRITLSPITLLIPSKRAHLNDSYMAYKPMRNYLRGCNLNGSLYDVWHLSCQLDNSNDDLGLKRPNLIFGINDTPKGVYKWDLPNIAREVILHADPMGKVRLNSGPGLKKVIEGLRATENSIAIQRFANVSDPRAIMGEVFRISQLQFPWQQQTSDRALLRNSIIFSSEKIQPILEEQTGLTASEYFFLGFAVSGSLLRSYYINQNQSYEAFGIPQDKSKKFFEKVKIKYSKLKNQYSISNVFDRNWDFRWNPLIETPLIEINPNQPNILICPVPELMKRRFSIGVYYDLNKHPDFGNLFGKAFEEYFTSVVKNIFPLDKFSIQEEVVFKISKKEQRHGPDLIINGSDGSLFVECKTKRLNMSAKLEPTGDDMREQVRLIAVAVVQHYKNILEAKQGITPWIPRDLPIIPLVVTLEDWYFILDQQELLKKLVLEELSVRKMDPNLINDLPYNVMSTKEFEDCAGTIADVGINTFFSGIKEEKYKGWGWHAYLKDKYPNRIHTNYFKLFGGNLLRILPEQSVPEHWKDHVS